MWGHDGAHICTQLCKGGAGDVGNEADIHILMHIHILTKIQDRRRVGWDTHAGTQGYIWGDMHSFTDACGHFKRGVGLEEG